MQKIKISFLIAISILLLSCNKYLDKKQNAELIVPTTLADLQALLDNGSMNLQRSPCYGEVSCDEYFIKASAYEALSEDKQQYYTWRPYFFGTGNDWSACYQAVYTANLVLDLVKDISINTGNKDSWNNVKGSALFFRSYYFLWLLWNYAQAYDKTMADNDWGIALRLTSDFNVPSVRATNKVCYDQVISDVKQSIGLLPDYPLNVMRPSKVAAYGLLSRCYLSMRDYSQALLYADSCWQMNDHLMDLNGDPDIPGGIDASVPYKKYNNEIIFYSEMDLFYGSLYANSNARIDTALINLYGPGDLRKMADYKINEDGYLQFKGNYGASAYFSGIAADEILLIRAECLVRTGEIQKGMANLNTLLVKRFNSENFIPVSAVQEKDALRMVLAERRKELPMRGLRWMDIKRLNREGGDIRLRRIVPEGTYTLMPNANFYALPLPDDIIKLTGMPQNAY